MEKDYTETDFQKLDAVISMFEELEKALGTYVECHYQAYYMELSFEKAFLYSVERFRKIELFLFENLSTWLWATPIDIISSKEIITNIKDSENGNVLYSNNSIGIPRMKQESDLLREQHQINHVEDISTNLNSEGATIENEKIRKYFQALEDRFTIYRREVFGNIIADIEEEFYRENGFNIYDSTKIDYIAALDYYESKMPKGYTIYPKDNSRSSHL